MGFAAKNSSYAPVIGSAESANSAASENRNQASVNTEPPVAISKIFYTVEEAAARLGMKPSWLYERTRRKAIPHRRLGKYVRFTEDDLRAISEAAATGTLQ